MSNSYLKRVKGHVIPISEKTAWIFLEVELDDGTCGFGEATCFGQEKAVLHEIESLNYRIPDEGIPTIAPALLLLTQAERTTVRIRVQSAFEQALYDSIARRSGISVSQIFGGKYQSVLPCYANINRSISDRSPSGFAKSALKMVEMGYKAIKIAPFDGFRWENGVGKTQNDLYELGLERIESVRETLGKEVFLLIDCHFRFDILRANLLINDVKDMGVFWLEDIVDFSKYQKLNLQTLRDKANSYGIRIAGGEQLHSLNETNDLLSKGALDVILPDLRVTGLKNGSSILQLANQFGVSTSLHNPVGPVLDAVSQQIASAQPEFLMLERQVDESPIFNDLRGGDIELIDGGIKINERPGIGIDLIPSVLEGYSNNKNELLTNFTGVAGAGPDA